MNQRALEISAAMPDYFPFGYAEYLAEAEDIESIAAEDDSGQ